MIAIKLKAFGNCTANQIWAMQGASEMKARNHTWSLASAICRRSFDRLKFESSVGTAIPRFQCRAKPDTYKREKPSDSLHFFN
jgi:hypothetical protein